MATRWMPWSWPWTKAAKTPRANAPNFVESLSDVSSMVVPQSMSGRLDRSFWRLEDAAREGYKSSTWVYICVTRLMEAMASIPWVAYRRKEYKSGKAEYAYAEPDDPLYKIIEKPNPFWSWQQMIEMNAAHLHLAGNGYWYKVRLPSLQNAVAEVWFLSPDTVTPIKDANKYLAYYYQQVNMGPVQQVQPNDMIHFMLLDPANEFVGISPLMAGSKSVDTDRKAVDFQRISMENRGVVDTVIALSGQRDQETFNKNRAIIYNTMTGIENARLPYVVSAEDAKLINLGMTPVELDFLNSRKWSAVEICAIFGVPVAVASVTQSQAPASDIQTARKVFWLDTIIPRLTKIREIINRQLSPDFGEDAWIGFDISGVEALAEVFAAKVNTASRLWSMGYPINAINEKVDLGMPAVAGGDQGFLPANLVPADGGGMPGPGDGSVP